MYTDKLNVSKDGNLKVAGCLGKTFVGLTTNSYMPTNVGSYYAADNKCSSDPLYPGSHVCRAEEMLESVSCSVAGDPIRSQGTGFTLGAWINAGPPGFTSYTNDCFGWTWTAASPAAWGRTWKFDNTTGGYGSSTGCNISSPGLKYACCR